MITLPGLVVGFFAGVGFTLIVSAIVLFWKGACEIHGLDDRRHEGTRW